MAPFLPGTAFISLERLGVLERYRIDASIGTITSTLHTPGKSQRAHIPHDDDEEQALILHTRYRYSF